VCIRLFLVYFLCVQVSFHCVYGFFRPLALRILVSPISSHCPTFFWKLDISSFWYRTPFEFVPRNLSFWTWWILEMWHFHWNLSYSVQIHADMFQNRIFFYFLFFLFRSIRSGDVPSNELCHTWRHHCIDTMLCCSVLQCAAVCCSMLQCMTVRCSVLQYAAVCCSVLQCVAVCCSVLQCVAVCCSVLQRVPGRSILSAWIVMRQ